MLSNKLGWLPLLGALLFLLGCGKPTGELKGKVLLGKDPLPGGSLQFEFSGGETATVPIKNDGTFSVTDLPVGSANVGVIPPAAPKMNPAIESKMKAPAGVQGKENYYGTTKAVKMKDKFRSPANSGLKAQVKAGKNDDVTFTVD